MQQGTLHPSSLSRCLLALPWPAVPVCSSTRFQIFPATSAASVAPPRMPKLQPLPEALAHDDFRSKEQEGQGRRQSMDRLSSGKPSTGLPCSDSDAQQQAGPQRPQRGVCTAAAARGILGAGSLQSGFPFSSPGMSTPHPCMGGGCSAEQAAAWRILCHTLSPHPPEMAQHTKQLSRSTVYHNSTIHSPLASPAVGDGMAHGDNRILKCMQPHSTIIFAKVIKQHL